jgi:hypothetical protein
MVDQGEEDSDGVFVSDSGIELIEVDSFPLRVTFCDPSSLVSRSYVDQQGTRGVRLLKVARIF